MRLLTGAGTPREFILPSSVWLLAYREPNGGLGIIIFVYVGDQAAASAIRQLRSPLLSDQTRSVENHFCNGLLARRRNYLYFSGRFFRSAVWTCPHSREQRRAVQNGPGGLMPRLRDEV